MSEVKEAINAMADRKYAATGRERGDGTSAVPLDVHRSIMTGLDLDYEELQANMDGLFRTFGETLASALADNPLTQSDEAAMFHVVKGVTAGFWVDGLLTGVLLQQRREGNDE